MPSQKLGVDRPHSAIAVRGVVPPGALGDRRDDAGGNADRERDHDREARELERHRQLLGDQRGHRLLHAQRLAEVALHHAAEPVEVAHRQRLVEVHLLAQVRDDARVAVLAGEHHRRIAGQQLLQPEDQDRDEQQRRQDRGDAPGEERIHRADSPACDAATAASAPARARGRRESCAGPTACCCTPTASGGGRGRRSAGP